jgi:glycerol kinase
VSGQQVSINAVDVEGNNGAGIQLNGTSRVVSVVGNKVRGSPTAISIAAGADQFTVVGNSCFANGKIDNAAGTGASRIVTGNTR